MDPNEECIPQRAGVCNDGMKYELQVMILVASRLTCDPHVHDYYIVTSPKDVDGFDDIVAIVDYTSGEKRAIMLQVKHSQKPMRLILHDPKYWPETCKHEIKNKGIKYVDIPIYKYLETCKRIREGSLNNKKLIVKLEDIPFQNCFFGIFTTMEKVEVDFEPGKFTPVPLSQLPRKTNLSFISTNQHYSKMSLQRYGDQFVPKLYLFPKQANSNKIYTEIQPNMPHFTNPMIDHLCNNVKKRMNRRANKDMECSPLTKKMFFENCLEVMLSQTLSSYINNCNNLKDMTRKTFKMWQSIFKEHNLMIIDTESIDRIMTPLFSFYQELIRREYNLQESFSWGSCIENYCLLNKATIKKTQNSIFTSTNLSDLLIYLWSENKIPIIINDMTKYWFHNAKNALSRGGRQFILIVNKNEEIAIPHNMSVFRSIYDITNKPYFDDIMRLKVLLEGSNVVPLKDVINDSILKRITAADILEWTCNGNQPIKIGKRLEKYSAILVTNQMMCEQTFTRSLVSKLNAISNDPSMIMSKSTSLVKRIEVASQSCYFSSQNLLDPQGVNCCSEE